MKSQTSQVARSCRIREWASMFQECRNRPNGMSVDKWCQENNITKVTAVDANSALIQDSFLDISANGMTIRVTEQTSSSLLKKVLEVLAHVE